MRGIEQKHTPSVEQADPPLLVNLQDGILRLTLNRPKKRNSLSEEMIEALHSALNQARDDANVRVVILAGSGPAFSAGHDLKEIIAHRKDEDQGSAYFTWLMAQCAQMMQSISNCPKPVIAEVDGIATAAGCQLVASCDLAIASETSVFSTPGVNIGLFCSTPMIPLSRNVAPKHAMEMLLTGDFITAEHAARIGLINYAVAQDQLQAETQALALKIASKSVATIALGKQAFYKQKTMELSDAYKLGSAAMIENMQFNDANEGINSFIEKRAPSWKDC